MKYKIYIITGPTASGKSAYAVDLALKINGEVISADSRQVYIGLDIGTAKVTTAEMRGVRHHLLDICEPKLVSDVDYEPFSVSDWLYQARTAIEDIVSRDRVPIVCGGTGFYIDALLYGLPDNGAPDHELRRELDRQSIEQLNKEYNLNINNKRRLIRTIEILKSGRVIQPRSRIPIYDATIIDMYRENNLNREILRSRLVERATERCDAMIKETQTLINIKHIDHEWLSTVGIEYRQILNFLNQKDLNKEIDDNDNADLVNNDYDELISLIVTKSMQYAKRQSTWNRKFLLINQAL